MYKPCMFSRKLYEKEENIKKFLKNLMIILLILLLLYVIISKFYYNEQIVKIGGIGSLIVITDSMKPTINSKEMIIIREQSEYSKNDIITYKDFFGRLITHRIVDIDGDNVITKGDNNNAKDDVIKKSNIQGKVIFHSKILGTIYIYVLKPLIIIICLGYLFNFLKYILFAKILLKIGKYC